MVLKIPKGRFSNGKCDSACILINEVFLAIPKSKLKREKIKKRKNDLEKI
jgi:hypothetical protein